MTIDIESRTFELRDEFHRKGIAEKVISLLTSDLDVSPMVIDGGWGTGKTEFCHKLIHLMNQKEPDKHHIIYIDAYLADHADEPLLTVLAEVLKLIPENKRDGIIQKILPAIRYGLKASGKAALGHILKQDGSEVIDGFEKEITQAADKAIDASVESLLKDHIKASESLKTLKSVLKEIATDNSIILFIDELDRCRPNFAVNMLEMIKHTFDVEGVNFVLITNTDQLKASINHCYGSSVDAQRYLDKFLKFTFKLPHQFKGNGHKKTQVSIAHYQNLINQSSTLKTAELEQKSLLDLVKRIIKVNQLSLREIETLVRYLEIYQRLTNNQGLNSNYAFGYDLLSLFGVILFCIKPELASSIIIDHADAKDIGRFLGDDKIVDFGEERFFPEVYQVILTMLAQECYLSAELFTPSEKSQQDWKSRIEAYFDHCEPPRKLDIVVEAIDVLTLYK